MSFQLPVQAVIDLPQHARVMLIGATDTGKTTLAATLASALAQAGKLPVAVVDGDTGQSEIGSPGTVGLGVLTAQFAPSSTIAAPNLRSLSRIPMLASAFVGSITPQGHALDTASAIIQMTQSAMLLTPRPSCVLIDTPGFVTGSGASLLRMLIEVIRPHLVIALARGAELEPILRPLETAHQPSDTAKQGGIQLLRQPVAAEASRKSSAVRATRRAARFAQHLAGARELQFNWERGSSARDAQIVSLEKTWLSYGEPLPPHELQFISRTLESPCLYAERLVSGELAAIMGGEPVRLKQPPSSGRQIALLEQSLRVKRVLLEPASRYNGLLCGLLSARGDLLGVGLATSLDFLRRSLSVLTPVRTAGAVARIAFGEICLKPDGREIAQLTGGVPAKPFGR